MVSVVPCVKTVSTGLATMSAPCASALLVACGSLFADRVMGGARGAGFQIKSRSASSTTGLLRRRRM